MKVVHMLPVGFAPAGAVGSGWSCDIAGQNVTCERRDRLSGLSSYPPIDVGLIVSGTACRAFSGSVLNVATVSEVFVDGVMVFTSSLAPSESITGCLTLTAGPEGYLVVNKRGGYTIAVNSAEGAALPEGYPVQVSFFASGLLSPEAHGDEWSCVANGQSMEEVIVDPALLVSFCDWMRQQRGTCDATLCGYSIPIRDLLKKLGEDPGTFDAHSLRQFILDTSQRCGWASAKKCTTAVRMFLRFLIASGKCAAGLQGSIPVLAHWRLSSLPRYLQPEEVERVIASCDPAAPAGKRDRAILLLLARLGLRAGDIVQLRLGDLDWKEAAISVSGKGRRQTLMPLTQEIGEAIASYIRTVVLRPPSILCLFDPEHPFELWRTTVQSR